MTVPPFRHCERSEAIHLSAHQVTMDCFAPLAMTWRCHFRPSGKINRQFSFARSELVVQQHGLESDDRVPIVLVDENDSKEIPAVEHSIEGSQILGRDIDEVVFLVSAL